MPTYHLLHILIIFFKHLINHIMELMTAIVLDISEVDTAISHMI